MKLSSFFLILCVCVSALVGSRHRLHHYLVIKKENHRNKKKNYHK